MLKNKHSSVPASHRPPSALAVSIAKMDLKILDDGFYGLLMPSNCRSDEWLCPQTLTDLLWWVHRHSGQIWIPVSRTANLGWPQFSFLKVSENLNCNVEWKGHLGSSMSRLVLMFESGHQTGSSSGALLCPHSSRYLFRNPRR